MVLPVIPAPVPKSLSSLSLNPLSPLKLESDTTPSVLSAWFLPTPGHPKPEPNILCMSYPAGCFRILKWPVKLARNPRSIRRMVMGLSGWEHLLSRLVFQSAAELTQLLFWKGWLGSGCRHLACSGPESGFDSHGTRVCLPVEDMHAKPMYRDQSRS